MLHHFRQLSVLTEQQPDGYFTAVDADNYDLDAPIGWGTTPLEAIAGLAEQLRERGELED